MTTAEFAAATERTRLSADLAGQQIWAEAVTAAALAEGFAPATQLFTDETQPGWLRLDLTPGRADRRLAAARRPPRAEDGERLDRTRIYHSGVRLGRVYDTVLTAGRPL